MCRQMAVNNKFSSNMAESGNIYEFISGARRPATDWIKINAVEKVFTRDILWVTL